MATLIVKDENGQLYNIPVIKGDPGKTPIRGIDYYTDGDKAEFYAYIDGTIGAHSNDNNNPHNVTRAQLGLWNVDNTSDMDKPVSAAQAVAIGLAKKTGTLAKETADRAEADANVAQRTATSARIEATKAQSAAEVAQATADKKLQMVRLWKNDTPTANFKAKTIAWDLSTYDAVMINLGTSDDGFNGTYVLPVGSGTKIVYGPGAYTGRRSIKVTTSGVVFGTGSKYDGGWGDSDAYMKPLEIYGLRGVQ